MQGKRSVLKSFMPPAGQKESNKCSSNKQNVHDNRKYSNRKWREKLSSNNKTHEKKREEEKKFCSFNTVKQRILKHVL